MVTSTPMLNASSDVLADLQVSETQPYGDLDAHTGPSVGTAPNPQPPPGTGAWKPAEAVGHGGLSFNSRNETPCGRFYSVPDRFPLDTGPSWYCRTSRPPTDVRPLFRRAAERRVSAVPLATPGNGRPAASFVSLSHRTKV